MLCQLCGKRPAEQRHHLFPQTQWNRRTYGKLLDNPVNVMYLCSICHLNKCAPHISEDGFCQALGIAPQSKSAQDRAWRERNSESVKKDYIDGEAERVDNAPEKD